MADYTAETSQEEKDELAAFNKAIGLEPESPPEKDVTPPADEPKKEGEPPVEEPVGEDKPPADAPQGTPPSGETPPADITTATGAAPPADKVLAAPAAPPPPAAAADKALLDRVDALTRDLEEVKKGQKAPEGTSKAPVTQTPEPAKEEPIPEFVYNDEQKAAIDWVETEFPDIKKAFDALVARQAHDFEQRIVANMRHLASQVVEYVAPIRESHGQSVQERHLAAVKGAVPDFDEIVGLVPDWVNQQPGTLGETYRKVLESGTTPEVVAMLNTFKKDTGRVQPQAQSPDPKSTETPPVTTAAPSTEKVNALTVVKGGGRTTPKPSAGTKPDLTEEDAFALAIGETPK